MADGADSAERAPSASRPPEGDPRVRHFTDALRARHGGGVLAVLMYGSYGRGQRDTVLDFYVLLERYRGALPGWLQPLANRLLPPNVYHVSAEIDGVNCAAKYATVTLAQFERGIAHDFHSYFWARFAQPFVTAYCRNAGVAARLEAVRGAATRRMIGATAPMLPPEFTTRTLWVRALTLTYGCELRAENAAKATQLFDAYERELDIATAALAAQTGLVREPGEVTWRYTASGARRRLCAASWLLRRLQGKLLSIARLFKAAFTFNDPLGYILWKVERHTGVRAEPTALQRRHPLVFSWGLLWRVYRQGGFR